MRPKNKLFKSRLIKSTIKNNQVSRDVLYNICRDD